MIASGENNRKTIRSCHISYFLNEKTRSFKHTFQHNLYLLFYFILISQMEKMEWEFFYIQREDKQYKRLISVLLFKRTFYTAAIVLKLLLTLALAFALNFLLIKHRHKFLKLLTSIIEIIRINKLYKFSKISLIVSLFLKALPLDIQKIYT